MAKTPVSAVSKSKSSSSPRLVRLALLAAVVFAIFETGRLYENGSLDDTIDAVEDFVVAQAEALGDLKASLF